ncbi:MAG TPA: HGxxPAAW family protein [Streptosporangiaceae bacterium]|nr:HGxxPAAW family protein [Streptosporangiaceae bacterium]
MADQASSDFVAVAGHGQAAVPTDADNAELAAATGAGTAPYGHHGRTASWIAVVIVLVGFMVGGAGLVFGPTWLLFWVGLGVAGVGGILALSTGIFDDWY